MKRAALMKTALAIVAVLVLLYLISNGYKNYHKDGFAGSYTLTAYTVDWCPHCQTFQPELAKLRPVQTVGTQQVNIVSVDPEKEPSKKNPAVKGYPTIILTKPDGSTKEYSGARKAADIQSWLAQIVPSS